ncbi:MAG: 2-hydroxyacyl-CoA dehydratase family protein [Verrucomicrobia bacterium]|nr:2-hydroxyacyl-CoA dehydratase family protein [Verrucomicrobiota bacterium]
MDKPAQITLWEWDARYWRLEDQGLEERFFGGPLHRHVQSGDTRLAHLKFDNSPAALALWNLLLSENDRLARYRRHGMKIVGTMKDLGTVPVMALSFENLVAFYPDGAWWTPCLMEQNEGLFTLAARIGLDESLCPVRAMAGAFINREHFPIPDLLISSSGAVCDDFSVIAQRLQQLGFPVHWWEVPHRRTPSYGETAVRLSTGFYAATAQVQFVQRELQGVRRLLEDATGHRLTASMLSAGIRKANKFREVLARLRYLVYTAEIAPIGSLEMLISEMLAIHFCSDYSEALVVLQELLLEIEARVERGIGVLSGDAVRVFWINPVADLRVMNLLEECGGRVCGSEYLFAHALDSIPEDTYPMEALARAVLADPMVGSTLDRARRILGDIRRFGAEGVVISRIPGASHCAYEGELIGETVRQSTGMPVVEIEVPSLCDSIEPSIRTRLEALIETIKTRKQT